MTDTYWITEAQLEMLKSPKIAEDNKLHIINEVLISQRLDEDKYDWRDYRPGQGQVQA